MPPLKLRGVSCASSGSGPCPTLDETGPHVRAARRTAHVDERSILTILLKTEERYGKYKTEGVHAHL